jgi:hypothetical protein
LPRLDRYWVNKVFFCDRVIGCLHRQAAPLERLDMDDGEELQPTHLGRFGVATPGLAWRKNLGNFTLIEVV